MFCPKCGSRYDGDKEHCEKCGSLLMEDIMSNLKRSKEEEISEKGINNLEKAMSRLRRQEREIAEKDMDNLKDVMRELTPSEKESAEKGMDTLKKIRSKLRQQEKEKAENKGTTLIKGLNRFKQPESEVEKDKGMDKLIKGLRGDIRLGKETKEDKDMNNLKGFNNGLKELERETLRNKGKNISKSFNSGLKQPERKTAGGMDSTTKTMILACIVLLAGVGVIGIFLQNSAVNTSQYPASTPTTTAQQNPTAKWHQTVNYIGAGDHSAKFTIQGGKFNVTMSAVPKSTYSTNFDVNILNGDNSMVGSGSLSWSNTESPNKKEYVIPVSEGQGTYEIVIHSTGLEVYKIVVWDYY